MRGPLPANDTTSWVIPGTFVLAPEFVRTQSPVPIIVLRGWLLLLVVVDEQAPWKPLLATQTRRSLPAVKRSWELGCAAFAMSP